MDLRTGKTYETAEDARRDGVPDADLIGVEMQKKANGKVKFKFLKGSFKPVEAVEAK